MCANSEGSDETVRIRRLARRFAGHLCGKYHNTMSWLISRFSKMHWFWFWLTFSFKKSPRTSIWLSYYFYIFWSFVTVGFKSFIWVRSCAQPWAKWREGCRICHYLSWTDSVKQSLLFSNFGCCISKRSLFIYFRAHKSGRCAVWRPLKVSSYIV